MYFHKSDFAVILHWGYFPLAGPRGIAGMVCMVGMAVAVWMAGWSGMNLRRTVW